MNRFVKYSNQPFQVNGRTAKRELQRQVQRCEVAILLSLGYSNKHIMKEVGASESFIQSVVRATGIYRADYRNGVSPIAQWVSERARSQAQRYVQPRLPPVVDLVKIAS